MKKQILTCIIAIMTITVSAQFGLRAGVDAVSLNVDVAGQSVDTDGATGFYVGVFTSFNISEKISIRPEVNYIVVAPDVENTEVNMDQLQIPVLLQLGLGKSLVAMAGPSFGLRLDTDDDEESFNFGIDMGLALNLGKRFFIEARYGLGMSDLWEKYENSPAELKMNGFQVGLGFKF